MLPRIDPDRRQWNHIPEHEREEVVKEALEQPEKSPGELAFNITDTREWFISESSVYRILKSRDFVAQAPLIAYHSSNPPTACEAVWSALAR